MKNRFTKLAHTPRLLIATDFDGTMAAIVERPELARPAPGTLELLRRAASLPQTCVAVVSGRAIGDLRDRLGPLEGAWLVGGHGAEISGPHREHLPDDVAMLLEAIGGVLHDMAPESSGFIHERKPASIAVHYRAVAPEVARPIIDDIVTTVAKPGGLHVRKGKKVVELLAVDADKGRALRKLISATAATGALYLGDDVTDEDAFRAARDCDIAVKIGEPPSAADSCVRTIEEGHAIVQDIISQREAWLKAVSLPALQRHSILSDQRTLAVVGPGATIRWMCAPRIDSSAVFASLLGGDQVGYWSIMPSDGGPPTGQRYLGDSFILETSWRNIRVTDYLDASGGRSFQRAGRTDLVRVVEGRGAVKIVLAPRLDFGRVKTRLVPVEGGLLIEGIADPMALYAPGLPWCLVQHSTGQTAEAHVRLDGSAPLIMELRVGTRSLTESRLPEPQRRALTDRVWSGWSGSLRLPPIATTLCRRSALMLRSLVYGPTGAILAAGTTSLPENAGGVRNWDYRFCWPRDAAVASMALARLGNTGTAMRYLDWLLGIVDRCSGPERLRPIYTVTGEELGPEAELSHLPGYRDSRPVRIGNAAAQQVQLDVFGPVVDLVHMLADAGAAISPDHWRLVEAMATAVERSWHEPDHGIWEVRTERRHHVHSKVMCWLALDRATKVADQFVGVRRQAWESLRDRIREDVLEHGYSRQREAFVAAYDLHEADAAVLAIGLSGLIEPDDPRFVRTVDLVQRELQEGGTVYRYRYEDGLSGTEGGFHLCTSWLIESLVRIGRHGQALELFDALCRSIGHTGVMTEQWCPAEQTGLGNLPQAYSHAALINSAVVLSPGQGAASARA
ncbi:MAG: trehalose-phosphatase [Phycisphaerales bacterium]